MMDNFNLNHIGAFLPVHVAAAFNCSRGDVLVTPLPPVRDSVHTTTSTTKSRFRLRWDGLFEWTTFEADAIRYFTTVVTPPDLAALVANLDGMRTLWEAVTREEVRTEADIKHCIMTYVQTIQNQAANGANGTPLPSDQHSSFIRIEPGAGSYGLIGVSDFAMLNVPDLRTTLVGEIKNPWTVTPQQIDDVIDGHAPVQGLHPGRLAVEQLYGYMTRNAKAFGILTTLRGWCFAFRRDGGILHITRMFRFGPDAAAQYYPCRVSVMMAIYYLSHAAYHQADIPETTQGQPGYIYLPYADPDQTSAAPHRQRMLPPGQQVLQPAPPQQVQGYHGYVTLYTIGPFEPWRKETRLGPKSWIVGLVPAGKAVLKLWTEDGDEQKQNERNSYEKLKPLWGKCVPSFMGDDVFPHANSIVLQYVEASPLSQSNLTTETEQKIFEAFDKIHRLGVVHNDVRPDNILISSDNSIWVIDFECAAEGNESKYKLERDLITSMIAYVRRGEQAPW